MWDVCDGRENLKKMRYPIEHLLAVKLLTQRVFIFVILFIPWKLFKQRTK